MSQAGVQPISSQEQMLTVIPFLLGSFGGGVYGVGLGGRAVNSLGTDIRKAV